MQALTNKDLNFIKTSNGKFYVSMNYADAQKVNLAKRKMRTDFTDIDTNSDGILSSNEILRERKKEANIQYMFAGLFALWGTYDFIMSAGSLKSKLLWAVVDVFLAGSSLLKGLEISKGNKNIQNFLNKYQNYLNNQKK